MPASDRHEPCIVEKETAAAMLEVLPLADRAIWATAFYAGLRRGELWALRWKDVDLGEQVIRVLRLRDAHGEEVEPKSGAGRRTVPIIPALAAILEESPREEEVTEADALTDDLRHAVLRLGSLRCFLVRGDQSLAAASGNRDAQRRTGPAPTPRECPEPARAATSNDRPTIARVLPEASERLPQPPCMPAEGDLAPQGTLPSV